MDSKPEDERAIRREMDIYERLKQIPNPHLLAVRDIFREEGRYALVTEYADGGTLWDVTAGPGPDAPRVALDEATVKDIALAMLDGLCASHENEIVHRDIKPENILRCDDTWKIADFGISKLTSSPVTGFTMQSAHFGPLGAARTEGWRCRSPVRGHLCDRARDRIPSLRIGEGGRLRWAAGPMGGDHQALPLRQP